MNHALRTLIRDALAILLCGVALGAAFNFLQRSSRPPRGLAWIAATRGLDSVDSLVSAAAAPVIAPDSPPAPGVATAAGAASAPAPTPAAPTAPAEGAVADAEANADAAGTVAPLAARPRVALPVIPDTGRPLKVGLSTVARLVEAEAAMVVDAREPGEFADGHIPGAVNLPYDEVARDPGPLQRLDAGGRPIIVYCSGGTCEASWMLAEMMMRDYALRRVLVYEEGFPDWVAAGKLVAKERP